MLRRVVEMEAESKTVPTAPLTSDALFARKASEESSRVGTRLTRAGKMFLTLMLLFYVASVTSQSGLLLLFIGLIGGCFIVNFSFGRRNVQNLKITAPKDVFLVEGGKAGQPWRIENQSKKHLENIQIIHEDDLL